MTSNKTLEPWGKQDNRRTAHITRVRQHESDIMTLVMTEKQLLELVGLISIGLRERVPGQQRYELAIRPGDRVNVCHANPRCEGGIGRITLVARRAKAT
jgi:hypothetical protein